VREVVGNVVGETNIGIFVKPRFLYRDDERTLGLGEKSKFIQFRTKRLCIPM